MNRLFLAASNYCRLKNSPNASEKSIAKAYNKIFPLCKDIFTAAETNTIERIQVLAIGDNERSEIEQGWLKMKSGCEKIHSLWLDSHTHYRGLVKLRMQALLTFACMNLIKLTRWKKINELLSDILPRFGTFGSCKLKRVLCINFAPIWLSQTGALS